MAAEERDLRRRLARWIPVIGTAILVAWMIASADLAAAGRALLAADLAQSVAVLALGVAATWTADAACMRWMLVRTLGRDVQGLGYGMLLRLKAASYVLNIVNYNAATLGMGWVVARRSGVGFVRAAAALAVLSWLDLVALALLVAIGLGAAPWVVGGDPRLQATLSALTWLVPSAAVAVLAVARLARRRDWAGVVRRASPASWWRRALHLLLRVALEALGPLGALRLVDTLLGVALRASFVMLYVAINYGLMSAFGMRPTVAELLVLVPIVAIVGVLPLSISGIGTTQLLARVLYARFVPEGVAATPLIDAYTTAMIVGFVAARLVVALPFLPAMGRELLATPSLEGS